MRDVMGLIYTSKNDLTMRELTASRAVGALPVAGRYRMIDFVLSNMVNSGVRNVGVIMQRNYHSLMDHLGSGIEWDLHIKNDGLFILPPFLTKENVGTYEGILDALRSNMGYLRRSKQEYVILTNSHTVFNCTFADMIEEHEKSGMDISLMYTRVAPDPDGGVTEQKRRHVYLDVSDNGRVTDLEIGPINPSCNNFYMDVMLLRRSLLIQLVDQAYSHSVHDFNRDLLQRYIRNGLIRAKGYQYAGYNRRVESVKSYFAFHMDIIRPEIRRELFNVNPVYTKVRDEVPAYYSPDARVKNSLVADGCIIEGAVENSVLFRGVKVSRDAVVRNSILMQEDCVCQGVELENVILDKNVMVKESGRLIATPDYPVVIGKNTTI